MALFIVAVFTGCGPSVSARPLTLRDIAQVNSGFSTDVLGERFGFLIPVGDVPCYHYKAAGGGIYVFCYLPTNELPIPDQLLSGDLPLVAVVKATSVETFSQGKGVYVYPEEAVGVQYTGLKIIQ